MSDYWLGVLSAPALILAVLAGWAALKALGWLGERLLVGGISRLTPSSPEPRRAAVAAAMFGGKRVWMLAPGDIGLALIVGFDSDEAQAAANRLRPRVEINPRPRPRPRPKSVPADPTETEPEEGQ